MIFVSTSHLHVHCERCSGLETAVAKMSVSKTRLKKLRENNFGLDMCLTIGGLMR